MQKFSFRAATAHDALALVELVNQAYRSVHAKNGWTHEAELVDGNRTNLEQINQRLTQANSMVLLAWQENQLAGCVHAQKHLIAAEGQPPHTLVEIGMLAVRPILQGSGLGKQLLAQIEHMAQRQFSPEKFRMQVIAVRSELIAFYQRRGYRDTGRLTEYPLSAGVGTPKHAQLKITLLEKLVNA